jgi:hypothetical protein
VGFASVTALELFPLTYARLNTGADTTSLTRLSPDKVDQGERTAHGGRTVPGKATETLDTAHVHNDADHLIHRNPPLG